MPQLYPESVQRLIAEFGRLPGIGARSAERLAFHVLSSSRDEAMGLALAIRDVKQSIRACTRCFNTAEGTLCPVCRDHGRDAGLLCVVELPRDIIALEKCGGYEGLYHVLQGRLDPLSGVGPERLRIAELFSRLHKGEFLPANAESAGHGLTRNEEDALPEAIEEEVAEVAAVLEEETPSEAAANLVANQPEEPEQESVHAETADTTDFRAGQTGTESAAGEVLEEPVREVILALNPTTEGDATANYLAQELAAEFPGLRITRLARGLASGTDLESSAPSSLQYALSGRREV